MIRPLEFIPLADVPDLGYGPIAVLLGLAVGVGAAILFITHALPKAKRQGEQKHDTYEAGMDTIGDARRRFNVKFYLVAVMFLIFDVELIFLYPWAVAFIDAKSGGALAGRAPFLFWVMVLFFIILTLGFLYEWGKGILSYD
ncbi:MAG: NADH-quinone oxidoreductase subunit A [Phycisphaerae bacterium]